MSAVNSDQTQYGLTAVKRKLELANNANVSIEIEDHASSVDSSQFIIPLCFNTPDRFFAYIVYEMRTIFVLIYRSIIHVKKEKS